MIPFYRMFCAAAVGRASFVQRWYGVHASMAKHFNACQAGWSFHVGVALAPGSPPRLVHLGLILAGRSASPASAPVWDAPQRLGGGGKRTG